MSAAAVEPRGKSPERVWTGIALSAILAAGVILRVRGITFGLPAVYNPDEIAIMSRALAFATGDLNPHNFLYPTLFFYVLFAWIGGYFVFGRLTGLFPSAAAFERQFFVDPSDIYLAGRMLGVVCGVLTILAVYDLGRRVFNRGAGLSAAAFLAIAPFAVRDAHYVKHDVPVTLLIVLAYSTMAKLVSGRAEALRHMSRESRTGWGRAEGSPYTSQEGRTGWRRALALPFTRPESLRHVVAAGTLTGFACSTHYYAIFLAVPLAWALWVHAELRVDRFLRSLLVAGAAAAAAFFIASPFLLVEPATAIRDVIANREIVVDRAVAGSAGLFANGAAYLRMLLWEAVGWPVLVLALAGAVWLVATSPRIAVFLLAFPLVFLAFISNTVAAGRYLNPVLPFVALLAGAALERAARARAARSSFPRAGPLALLVMTAGAAVHGTALSIQTGTFFRQTDTRTLAQRFIESAIARGSTIAVQPYSTPLRPSPDTLIEGLAAHGLDPRAAPTKFARQLALDPYPAPAYRLIYVGDGGLDLEKIYVGYGELGGARGLAALRQRGVQYVVIKRYNRPDPVTLPFLEALASEGTRLAVFSPFRPDVPERERVAVEPYLHNTDTPLDEALERPGPMIEVWKLL